MHRLATTSSRLLILALGVVVAGVGCSAEVSIGTGGGPVAAAEEFIEGSGAEEAGLGPLEAACNEPSGTDVGIDFLCTGTTEDGREIEFVTTIDEGDTVSVNSVNLVTPAGLDNLEASSVAALEAQVGEPLGVENFDCGSEAIILEPDNVAACVLTDPVNGDVYDVEVTIDDPSDPNTNIDVLVADTPR